MSSAQVFTDNWNVYQKIVLHDYMHHQDFAVQTRHAWDKRSPSRVLDMGCGDAGTMLPHLLVHPVVDFTGYDLSGHALQLAAMNLQSFPGSIELQEGDMLGLLEQEPKKFDIIHSSFAIHHLGDEDKQLLFKACHEHLNPGGVFIYTDIFRQPGQNREDYITTYFSVVEKEWVAMETWEKQIVYDHVAEYDFPAEIGTCKGWLQAIGFELVHHYQPDKRHMMLQLKKS